MSGLLATQKTNTKYPTLTHSFKVAYNIFKFFNNKYDKRMDYTQVAESNKCLEPVEQ